MKKVKKEYYFVTFLFICFIILTMFVVKGEMDTLDKLVFNKLITFKSDFLTTFLYVITSLASTLGTIFLLVFIAVFFLKKKMFSVFKYVICNVGIGIVLMQILKIIIGRVRPAWKWITQGGFSYPSGHTITSVLLYGTLILLVSKKVKGNLKKPLIIILTIMILLTGLSRIYFGVHYLTDVVASLILGSIILIISNMIMERDFNNDKNKIK